jgi:ferritin
VTASIPTGGSVTIQAQVSGFTAPPFLDWWMQEQHDAGMTGSQNCDDIKPINQDLIPGCKF